MANDYIVINDDLRTMQIPSSITILGVESDDDVNKIPFQMPKEYCGFDLSTFEARINYMNANGVGDIYIVEDLAVDGDDPSLMNFTWLVGRNACAYKGNTQFIVCLKKFDNDDNVVQEFNTTVYSLPVLQGLETTEAVIQENADIIEQILNMLEDAGGVDLSNYYTKAEVNALKLANPEPLIINGTSYDGSEEVELTIEGSSNVLSSANGQIIHLTDAVPNVPLESMTLYDSNDSVITSASIAVANKNLFRNDLIAQQTVSKGITFEKNSTGAIHATGTSTGTYASAQCTLDPAMFVVGQTYTISSGKESGILYVQLILNYSDGTTDYLVSSNQPYTFTLAKPVTSATGCVQITASGVTVDEWIYPMIELDDHASAFVDNIYSAMTYDGSTLPVMPSSICNIWSNDSTVANIAIEYREDPVLGQLNAMQEQIDTITEHDDQLDSTSEHAVQNKVVTAALAQKITHPSGGTNGQILTKSGDQAVWSNVGTPTDEQVGDAVSDWLDEHPEATTTVQDGSITVAKLSGDAVAQMNSNKLTTAVKNAFLALFEHVAYVDGNGQTYLDALEAAFDERTVLSIDAVFTQGSAIIYTTDDLDDLKQYLVVTAYYDNGSTGNVTSSVVLSGTLEAGTSAITATYGGKTDTFNVTVTESYVTDGLIAYWDGINNTGSGHDASATKWTDLIGGYDFNFQNSNGRQWNDDNLELSSGHRGLYSSSRYWSTSENCTIEYVIAPASVRSEVLGMFDPNSSASTMPSGTEAREAVLYSDNTVGFKASSGKTYALPSGVSDITGIRKLAAVYSNYTVQNAYINNSQVSLSDKTHSYGQFGTNNFRLAEWQNTSSANSAPYYGKIYAVRVYNRALTQAEITQNFNYDSTRYNLGL